MVKVEETQSTPTVEFMAVTASDVAQNLQAFKNKGPKTSSPTITPRVAIAADSCARR